MLKKIPNHQRQITHDHKTSLIINNFSLEFKNRLYPQNKMAQYQIKNHIILLCLSPTLVFLVQTLNPFGNNHLHYLFTKKGQ